MLIDTYLSSWRSFLHHHGLQSGNRCSTEADDLSEGPPAPVPDHPRGLRNSVALDTPGPVGGHKCVNLPVPPQAVRHDAHQKTTNTPTNSTTIPYDFSLPSLLLYFPSVKVWSAPKKTDNHKPDTAHAENKDQLST
jgi:hypothetical protein